MYFIPDTFFSQCGYLASYLKFPHLFHHKTFVRLPCQMLCVGPLHRLTLCCWWTAPGVSGVLTSGLSGPSSVAWWESLRLVQSGSKLVGPP